MNGEAPNLGHASDMRDHASDAAGLMKALGNESRLMILCILAAVSYTHLTLPTMQ